MFFIINIPCIYLVIKKEKRLITVSSAVVVFFFESVKRRVSPFANLLFICKSLTVNHALCPTLHHLHSLLTPARQPRQLRSSHSNLLFFHNVKANVGTRPCSVAAPTLWKSLPVSVNHVGNITTFRRQLKTRLFKLAYPP